MRAGRPAQCSSANTRKTSLHNPSCGSLHSMTTSFAMAAFKRHRQTPDWPGFIPTLGSTSSLLCPSNAVSAIRARTDIHTSLIRADAIS